MRVVLDEFCALFGIVEDCLEAVVELELGHVGGVLFWWASVLLDERADLLEARYESVMTRRRCGLDREREKTGLVVGDDLLQPLGIDAQRPASLRARWRNSTASAIRLSSGSWERTSGLRPFCFTKSLIFGQRILVSSSVMSILISSIASWISLSTCLVTVFERISKARWNGLTESIKSMLRSLMLMNFPAINTNRLSPTSFTSPFLITESTTTAWRTSSTSLSVRSG